MPRARSSPFTSPTVVCLKWKLDAAWDPEKKATRIELYDLDADPAEARNIARREPELVRDLMRRLTAYRDEAVPALPPPRYPQHEIPAVWGRNEGGAPPGAGSSRRAERRDE